MIKIKLSNKPSFIYYVIFIAALFLSNTGDSQNLIFNHYGLNEGLPQETVLCITKDSKGFFWLGTSDGIVRFDGHDFTIPQPDYNSKSDIAGYRIGAALEHNNLLYVGTSQNGLLAYDLDYETTTQVLDSDTNCTRLSKYEELIIAAYYNKGVAVIEKNTQKFLHFNIENPKEIVGLAILKNQGYLATKQGAIYKFSLDNVSKNETIILEEIAHSDVEIINLVTIENTIFVGLEYGLLELNIASNVLNEIKIIDKNTPLNFRINTLKKANNTFYLATSNGILTAAKKQDTLKVIHHYKADKKDKLHTVSYNSINDLYVDDENLLIGSFNLEVTAIHEDRVFKKPLSVYNLTDASTFGVIDTKEYLFTATSSGLVISDNSNPSKYIVLPKIRGRHFVKDNHNNIWCATGNSIYIINLDTLDIDNPIFTEVPAETGNPSHLLSGNIRSLHKDLKGDIWAVSYNGGFSKFIGHVNSKDFSFINYSSEAFPSVFTISMIQDSYGTYWMTSQKGLSAFHFEGDKFQLKKNYDETHGLATRGVLGAFEDHEKTLWIATRKGISKYNRDDDRFISYGRRDGLTNTFVYDIHEDNAHELWLSTNGGLFKFNKDTGCFLIITQRMVYKVLSLI